MSGTSQPVPASCLAGQDALVSELFARSGAARFGFSAADFEQLLGEVARKYLPGGDAAQVRELLAALHVEELVLARACAAGHERAWDEFLTRYRARLYDAAWSIAREESAARELADSLYGDLYGTATRDGRRVSRLNSYMGRGSLEGWLRTVLAQQFVDRYRAQRRLVSLDEKDEEGAQFAAPAAEPAVAPDPRLAAATDAALAALDSEDRFVLASYFLDGRTLADIARVLGVHESTISRKIDKITSALRKQIRDRLVAAGMSRRQAEETLQADARDVPINIRARLAPPSMQESKDAAFSPRGTPPPGRSGQ